jgi:hypothetical protein
MKTMYSIFEDINFDLCGNECFLSIDTEALKPKVNLFGQIKISESGIKCSLMVISKAIINESLGIDLDLKLVAMLFGGYLSLIKQSLHLLQTKAFKRHSDHVHHHGLTYN